MAKDIETMLASCSVCNATKAHLQKEPLKLHDIPDLPWSTIATDVFEWQSNYYLVVVDSYSGWYEVEQINDMTSRTIISKMKRMFATHGIPSKVISDNARYYTSQEFKNFSQSWDFSHITSSPTYPQSNGLAERAVQCAKKLLERTKRDGSDFYLALLNSRNVPRDSTLGSSAQRLMSRRTRTTLPTAPSLLQPKSLSHKRVHFQLRKKRKQQKEYYDKSAKPLSILKPNQTVRMQTDRGFDRLAIVKQTASEPRSYVVDTGNGEYRRNRRHLLPVAEPPVLPPPETTADIPPQDTQAPTPITQDAPTAQMDNDSRTVQAERNKAASVPARRNPTRERKMLGRYKDYEC
jgi:hypothetical protein